MTATVTGVVCTCYKSFKDENAMLQHQRDSPKHRATPQPTSPQAFPVSQPLPQYLDDLVNGLSLQDATNDHPIIPLTRGRQLSTFRVGNPRLNFLKPRFAGVHANPFAAETTTSARQPKNEKASGKKRTHGRKRNSSTRATGSGLEDGWVVDSYSGPSNIMRQNQNWGLCDKDCGWCGHCGDEIL